MKSLTPLLIIVICVVSYFMYISPKMDDVNNLRVKLDKYKTTLDQAKELKITLDSMLSSYNAISEEDKIKLNKVVPEKFDSTLFVADVNGIALRNGISIKNIKMNDTSDGRAVSESESLPFKTVSATFDMEGQYEQFVKMLKDMESSLQLMDIKSLSIKKLEKTASSSSFEYTLEINTYYLR